MVIVIGLYALLASAFTIGKLLLQYLPPLFLTALRMIFSGSVLLIGYSFFAKQTIKIRFKDFFLLAFISIIHIVIPYATEFIAMQRIAPACAALLFNLSPFFTALFSYIHFKEKISSKQLFGMIISFLALIYFIYPNNWCLQSMTYDMVYPLLLFGVASASYAWILIGILIRKHHYSPVLINGIAMFLGGFESLFCSYLFKENVVFPWYDLSRFLCYFFVIVVIANLFYNLYGFLLKKYTATFLSFMGVVTPLCTAIYDFIFLHEPIHVRFIITLFMITIGVYLFYQDELKNGYKVL